ncbi:hypothetical protein G4B88_013991 [Cannabis sativa]|uniref:Zinc knuckle CX2CX4HX4C domain-containing protein n=1 Tax=Cannabis sativa TaxID=3483 RepID=A0A7J6I3E4_CANSA|nr:hypothetical protein G4B88_013991 [Cannabis sativa]
MKMRQKGGEWFQTDFKYEFVPIFYFACGIISHSNNFCHKFFDMPIKEVVKSYVGSWLSRFRIAFLRTMSYQLMIVDIKTL